MNPFLIKGYHSPQYFCDREQETKKLILAIENQQDVTLYAYRRLGKSALIKNVFYHLSKNYITVYADLWGTTSVSGMVKELANAIIRSGTFGKRGFGAKFNDFVKGLGASFSIGMDGLPTIGMMLNDRKREFTDLEQVFRFLQGLSQPVVLALDEFQEIKNYQDSIPLEGKLRALGQECSNIRFIYSGSEKKLLSEIFNKYDRPFYQSTRMIGLDKIDGDLYAAFIDKHFKAAKKSLQPDIIAHILATTYRHTRYVQTICNYLYGLPQLPKSLGEFDTLYYDFLQEQSVFYAELPDRVTRQQFEVIKAFARKGRVKETTGAAFLKDAGVSSTSSMSRVINALSSKQFIIKDEGHWRLYDVFLEHYLRFVAL